MQHQFSLRKARLRVALSVMFAAGLIATSGVFIASTASASAPRTKTPTGMTDAPVISSVKVTPSTVAGGGGTATITAQLKKSLSCQLRVVSKPLFKVTVPTAQACKSTYTAYVKLGANPTSVRRAVALDVVANDGALVTEALLYVSLAPKPTAEVASTPPSTPSATTTTTASLAVGGGGFVPPPPVSTTTTASPPTTTTTATTPLSTTTTTMTPPSTTTTTMTPPSTTTTTMTPPSTTTTTTPSTTTTSVEPSGWNQVEPLSPNQESLENWSGYAVTPGSYTVVSGIFTVPALTTDSTCNGNYEELASWVGVDGFNNSNLIQAGITEVTDGVTDCADGGSGSYELLPWWEILPAPATTITTWDDANPVTVGPGGNLNPGDQVEVTLWEASPGEWYVRLTDLTSEENFMTEQAYSGQADSAEWVLEAPDDQTDCDRVARSPTTAPTTPRPATAPAGQVRPSQAWASRAARRSFGR